MKNPFKTLTADDVADQHLSVLRIERVRTSLLLERTTHDLAYMNQAIARLEARHLPPAPEPATSITFPPLMGEYD
jgi:hypothetical protein